MLATWFLLIGLLHRNFPASTLFLCRSSHPCGALVRLSTWFCQGFTSVTPIVSAYYSTKACSVPKHWLTSRLCVCTRLSSKVVGHPLMHACWIGDYMQHSYLPFTGSINAFNLSIKYGQSNVPGIINLTQSKSIYYDVSVYSSAPPVATELASTQTTLSLSFTHHSPRIGSDSYTLFVISPSMRLRDVSLTSSSHPLVSALAWCLINVVVTLSQSLPTQKMYVIGLLWGEYPKSYLSRLVDPEPESSFSVAPDLYRLSHNLQRAVALTLQKLCFHWKRYHQRMLTWHTRFPDLGMLSRWWQTSWQATPHLVQNPIV